ncbi:c-type cytochrome [Prolixibacteraceae bacterium Z1-6]|uniref:C-type cytochrome n=1 Tax=Draconibacterium aestuarii TaxID=2998507 RepID=A0A9X3F4X6_9BACT|nr:c-type cytochrome [Prolixibacteraceae bacterium Z1-6]
MMLKQITKTVLLLLILGTVLKTNAQDSQYFSPTDMEIDSASNTLFILGKTAHELRAYPLNEFTRYKSISTELTPKAIQIVGNTILLATSHSNGKLLLIDKKSLLLEKEIEVGHGATDIAVNSNNSMAYVANQFSNDISVVNLKTGKETTRIPVIRQPTQVVLSENGKYLFATNFLTAGRADVDTVTSEVSIINTETEELIKNIPLANGSNALRGMSLSADGNYVFISHNLGRFLVPTTQLEQGWMNTSALSVIDAKKLEFVATVLLDDPEYGAAGSWGIDCSADQILVAHSGTHDFSVIDYHQFVEKLNATQNTAALSYDLRFLSGIRTRIKTTGNGPRCIKVYKNHVYAANYFSDLIDIINLNQPLIETDQQLVLTNTLTPDEVRLGEMYFNDATYCFQAWQSCNGCHPGEARTDGLNWDLLNDGMGNPKNCKSMLGSHQTAPVMITGIRPDAETAVRAGFTHIQFTLIEEEKALAVDAYLKSLQPVPSPSLVKQKLNPKAQKGQKLFQKLGCISCHYGPWYTDQKTHQIGTQGEYDHQNRWDTPTLVEVWRTGPYLHDGRSATLKEVFTTEKHGLREELSEKETEQLVEYILSL